MKWIKRSRPCTTVYTHPELVYQIIHYHNSDRIVWNDIEFVSVEDAMKFVEKFIYG